MNAHAYLRVSTDDQSNGIDAQKAAITAWSARTGTPIASWHTDEGVSGGAPLDQRPALATALERARNGDCLVVARRDRLAREIAMAVFLERTAAAQGGSVVSADGAPVGDSPEAVMMRRMMDVFAEYERGVIRARTKAALAVKKRKGERVGGIPFGYELDPQPGDDPDRIRPNDAEQRVLAAVEALHAAGMGYRRICRELERLQVPTRTGGRDWDPQQVKRMLRPSGRAAS